MATGAADLMAMRTITCEAAKGDTSVSSNRRQRRAAERGASLIEILTVLVIIVAGVLVIARIFPIGLGTLQTTGSRTLAGQLASQQSDLLKNDAQNLPIGVLLGYYDNGTGQLVADGTQDPDDLRPYVPAAAMAASNTTINPYFADVNRYRFIRGERVSIPPASTQSVNYGGSPTSFNVTGSFYLLKFGPIFIDPNKDGDPTTPPAAADDNYLKVYGAPLQGITVPYAVDQATLLDNSASVRGRLRGPQTYLIDYGDATTQPHFMFPSSVFGPAASKSFYFSYSYIDNANNGAVVNVPDTLISVNGPGDTWITPITIPANAVMVPGSEQIHRAFTRIAAPVGGAIAWSQTDPYEFALLSSNNDLFSGGYANIGLIAFNPHGANYGERTAAGQQNFVAYIDYSVLDWHIIREDRQVPLGGKGANGEVVVRTTLPHIKRIGDVEPGNTTYQGMFGPGSVDVVLLNADSGQVLSSDNYNGGSSPDPLKDYWVDTDERGGSYADGFFYINTARVQQGSHIRILYKAEGDWAVAVQKAYTNYHYTDADPATPTGFPPTNDPGAFSLPVNVRRSNDTNMYFNLCEANKSFVAQFQYTKTDGSIVQTPPVHITIGDVGSAVTSGSVQYAVAKVGDVMTDRQARTDWSVAGNRATGVSIKSRVIYHDANSNVRSVGTTDPNAGWRIQDLDTYLTASGATP